MSVFYTKQGDTGTSRITQTRTVSKTDPVIVVLGGLDELNSFLGLVRTQPVSPRAKKMLRVVQEDLFMIQANIALLLVGGKQSKKIFALERVSVLEKEIDALETIVKPARSFVISGSCPGSAWLDYARAMARRVELSVVRLCKTKNGKGISWVMPAYLNRLSSVLYALARYESKSRGKKEERPRYC